MPSIFKPERIPISHINGINEKAIQEIIAKALPINGFPNLFQHYSAQIKPILGSHPLPLTLFVSCFIISS
ncbi:MAG: hypothetical protein H0S84_07270 [Bacteroidales bacterium]|nr:hypothetical protein [Bacteroidales bacterium]